MNSAGALERLCGSLIVGGFAGPELPPSYADALRAGHRGGAILFRRNLVDVEGTYQLCAAIASASQVHAPLIGLDEEGGRVRRLPPPCLALPAARAFGGQAAEQVQRGAAQLGRQLRGLGFNIDFAPVLDVDSNPDNPVIGDRSFGATPEAVTTGALAFARGLEGEGIAACGKHFPGHGDTSVDSHVGLPRLDHGLSRFRQVEWPPFVAAAKAEIAALMSGHLWCPELDPERPATLSRRILTEYLRGEIGFSGVVFSDDLEMGAIAQWGAIAGAAVLAVEAGCDALLVCSDEAAQAEIHVALCERASRDEGFRQRCAEASARLDRLRQRFPVRPEPTLPALRLLLEGSSGPED